MIVPSVFAWIKKRNNRSSLGVNAREIGSFVRITSIACECETGRIVGTAMLFRHDVFQVKSNQGCYRLLEAAILTCVSHSLANQITSSLVQFKQPAAKDNVGSWLVLSK